MTKHSVLILPSAKKDIYEARKWYSQYSDELPVRFKEELKLIVEALKLRPGGTCYQIQECKICST